MVSAQKRNAAKRPRRQQAKGDHTSPGLSSLSPGTLGAGFLLLVVIGIAAGTLAAPQLFGRDKVGATTEQPEILGTDYTSTYPDQTTDQIDRASPDTGETVERFDWADTPAPRGSSSDDIEIEVRIEQAKARAYALLGQSDSIPFIHAEFYPFSEVALDRYYSALVDLTFVVDAARGVVSEICTGRAPTSSSSPSCATNPIELNP